MNNIENFKRDGFVYFKYPKELRNAVEEAERLWVNFCGLPKKIKESVPYSNGGAGVGYELKNGIGKNADRKENFDITIPGEDWVEKNISAFKHKETVAFMRKVGELVTKIKPVVLDFAKSIEKEYGIKDFKDEVLKSEGAFFVRFIHYFGDRQTGEEIATSHVDQSGFTLHLFESQPGFQYLSYDKKWKGALVTKGETLIIPSMQMQLRSEGEIKAMCHRVVATEETKDKGRYSMVCFVQLKDTRQYNKSKFGRLQEMEPGFNYNMTREEFEKMFI
jgi:isopenicillin N synthase-like dioxygenase